MWNHDGNSPAVGAVRARLSRTANRLLWVICLPGLGGCGDLLDVRAGGSFDSDGDGLSDRREQRLGTDPTHPDTDSDGVSDGDEIEAGTSPLARDSDGDGILDGQDDRIDPPSPRTGSMAPS